MGIEKAILKEFAKKGTYIIPAKAGNNNALQEWIKWLKYIPPHLLEELERINNKQPLELTIEELKVLHSFIDNKRLLDLFKRYSNKETNEKEFIEVYNYMDSNSIKRLML